MLPESTSVVNSSCVAEAEAEAANPDAEMSAVIPMISNFISDNAPVDLTVPRKMSVAQYHAVHVKEEKPEDSATVTFKVYKIFFFFLMKLFFKGTMFNDSMSKCLVCS